MAPVEPITVRVTRKVKPGREVEFEIALHEFVRRSLFLPGHIGVHIFRPTPGSNSREYSVIHKFACREALAAFRTSPEYFEWNLVAADLTEGDGRVEELTNLDRWFPQPDTLPPALATSKTAIPASLSHL